MKTYAQLIGLCLDLMNALNAQKNVEILEKQSGIPFWNTLQVHFPDIRATYPAVADLPTKGEAVQQPEWDAFDEAKQRTLKLRGVVLAKAMETPLADTAAGLPSFTLLPILQEVADERARQDKKWGQQNLPSVETDLRRLNRTNVSPQALCNYAGLLSPDLAREMCDRAHKKGRVTWAHVAVEELSEAVGAPDDAARRGELIQLMAVCGAWIECIDRAAQRDQFANGILAKFDAHSAAKEVGNA